MMPVYRFRRIPGVVGRRGRIKGAPLKPGEKNYELVPICDCCAGKIQRSDRPHRAVITLLESSWKLCDTCKEYRFCATYRDYGRRSA